MINQNTQHITRQIMLDETSAIATTNSSAIAAVDEEFEIYSPQEIQQLKEEGGLSPDASAILDRGEGGNWDKSGMYHRVAKELTKSKDITWQFPLTKKEKEDFSPDEVGSTLIIRGLRGIPIGSFTGFAASHWDEKARQMTNYCKTTKAVISSNDADFVYSGERPLPRVFGRAPHLGKYDTEKQIDKTVMLNYLWDKEPGIEFIAERKINPFATKEDAEFNKTCEMSCRDCVTSGQNRFTFLDKEGKPAIDKTGGQVVDFCKANTHMLYAVFYIGFPDMTRYAQDDLKYPIDIKWVPVKDAGLRDYKGDPITKPFILRVENMSSQLSKIGTGTHDIKAMWPGGVNKEGRPYFPPGRRKDTWLPENIKPMSFQDLDRYLNDSKGMGDRWAMRKRKIDGVVVPEVVYTTMIDMYSAPLAEKAGSSDFAPVFYESTFEQKGVYPGYEGANIIDLVKVSRAAQLEEQSRVEPVKSVISIQGTSSKTLPSAPPVLKTIEATAPAAVSAPEIDDTPPFNVEEEAVAVTVESEVVSTSEDSEGANEVVSAIKTKYGKKTSKAFDGI